MKVAIIVVITALACLASSSPVPAGQLNARLRRDVTTSAAPIRPIVTSVRKAELYCGDVSRIIILKPGENPCSSCPGDCYLITPFYPEFTSTPSIDKE